MPIASQALPRDHAGMRPPSSLEASAGPSEAASFAEADEALLERCRAGDEQGARALLSGADPLSWPANGDGRCALRWAIHHGWEDFAMLACERAGARANRKDGSGMTPLMHAANSGLAKLCAMLARGAAPRERDADGYTALMWACLGGQARCVRVLASPQAAAAKNKAGQCALEVAAACGQDECCLELIGWAAPPALEHASKSPWIKEGTRGAARRAALAWREAKELEEESMLWGEPCGSGRVGL